MKGIIQARKEKPGEFLKNKISWKDIQDVLDGIKEINFKMEVIK